jgi:hypothetical protein
MSQERQGWVPCGAGEFGAVRQSSARAVSGIPTSMPEARSVTTNAIDPTSLGVFPDTILSTTADPEKNIPEKFDRNALQL